MFYITKLIFVTFFSFLIFSNIASAQEALTFAEDRMIVTFYFNVSKERMNEIHNVLGTTVLLASADFGNFQIVKLPSEPIKLYRVTAPIGNEETFLQMFSSQTFVDYATFNYSSLIIGVGNLTGDYESGWVLVKPKHNMENELENFALDNRLSFEVLDYEVNVPFALRYYSSFPEVESAKPDFGSGALLQPATFSIVIDRQYGTYAMIALFLAIFGEIIYFSYRREFDLGAFFKLSRTKSIVLLVLIILSISVSLIRVYTENVQLPLIIAHNILNPMGLFFDILAVYYGVLLPPSLVLISSVVVNLAYFYLSSCAIVYPAVRRSLTKMSNYLKLVVIVTGFIFFGFLLIDNSFADSHIKDIYVGLAITRNGVNPGSMVTVSFYADNFNYLKRWAVQPKLVFGSCENPTEQLGYSWTDYYVVYENTFWGYAIGHTSFSAPPEGNYKISACGCIKYDSVNNKCLKEGTQGSLTLNVNEVCAKPKTAIIPLSSGTQFERYWYSYYGCTYYTSSYGTTSFSIYKGDTRWCPSQITLREKYARLSFDGLNNLPAGSILLSAHLTNSDVKGEINKLKVHSGIWDLMPLGMTGLKSMEIHPFLGCVWLGGYCYELAANIYGSLSNPQLQIQYCSPENNPPTVTAEKENYRRSFNVSEISGRELIAYPVSLPSLNTKELIATNKLKPDCSDIRFVGADSYWLAACNTETTTLTARIPNLAPNSNQTISMYYDNPLLTTKEDWTATFDFSKAIYWKKVLPTAPQAIDVDSLGNILAVYWAQCVINKFDSNGNLLWEKELGIPYVCAGGGFDSDGNVIVGVDGEKSIFLVKLDKNGAELWRKEFFRVYYIDEYVDIYDVDVDGNLIIAAVTGYTRNGVFGGPAVFNKDGTPKCEDVRGYGSSSFGVKYTGDGFLEGGYGYMRAGPYLKTYSSTCSLRSTEDYDFNKHSSIFDKKKVIDYGGNTIEAIGNELRKYSKRTSPEPTSKDKGEIDLSQAWIREPMPILVKCDDDSGCARALRIKLLDKFSDCPKNYAEYGTSLTYIGGGLSTATINDYAWVCAAAKDIWGNAAFTEKPVEFRIDVSGPLITATFTPDRPTDDTPLTVSASATDGASGLSEIKIFREGSLFAACSTSPCSNTSVLQPGTHTFTITATDNVGNSATFSKSIFVSTSKVHLRLERGWNLLSVPFKSVTLVLDTCDAANKKFYHFNASENKWQVVVGLENLKPAGYWMYTERACNITVKGEQPISASEIKLATGWNQIVAPELAADLKDIKGTCTIESALYYDTIQERWIPVTKIEPFKAYWIKARC